MCGGFPFLGIPVSVLWFALLVFALGYFVRSASYYAAEKKQKDEIIAVLKEIRDSLKKS